MDIDKIREEHESRQSSLEGLTRYPFDSAYGVSRDGRVVDYRTGRELEVEISAGGFPSVRMGDRKRWLNAVLCETFHGERGDGQMASWIAYVYGKPCPLTADNCEWTSKEIADERRKEAKETLKSCRKMSMEQTLRRLTLMVSRMSEENRERLFRFAEELYAESDPNRELIECARRKLEDEREAMIDEIAGELREQDDMDDYMRTLKEEDRERKEEDRERNQRAIDEHRARLKREDDDFFGIQDGDDDEPDSEDELFRQMERLKSDLAKEGKDTGDDDLFGGAPEDKQDSDDDFFGDSKGKDTGDDDFFGDAPVEPKPQEPPKKKKSFAEIMAEKKRKAVVGKPKVEELKAPEPKKEEPTKPEPPKEEEPKRELKPWEHGGPSNPNPQPLPEYVKPESGRGFWTDSMGQKHEIASADDPNAPF